MPIAHIVDSALTLVVRVSGGTFYKGISAGKNLNSFAGSVEFNDGLTRIDPYVFNGGFGMYGASAGIGAAYAPVAKMALGMAIADVSGAGFASDFISAGVLSGDSVVTSAKPIECSCGSR